MTWDTQTDHCASQLSLDHSRIPAGKAYSACLTSLTSLSICVFCGCVCVYVCVRVCVCIHICSPGSRPILQFVFMFGWLCSFYFIGTSTSLCVCVCPWVKWPLGFLLCWPHAQLHSPFLQCCFLPHLAALPWLPMLFCLAWLFIL